MVERGIGTMGAVIWGAVGLGCGGNTETADADSDWPKRVTLQASFAQASDAVRLADGEIVAQGGDVAFTFAVQLSLHQPDEALPIFCEKGKHEALAEVPDDSLPERELTDLVELRLLAKRAHEDLETFTKRVVAEVVEPGLGASDIDQLVVALHGDVRTTRSRAVSRAAGPARPAATR